MSEISASEMADMESLLNYSTILEGLVQQLQTRNDELRTALKKAMEILLTDDEQAKAELFLELKEYL